MKQVFNRIAGKALSSGGYAEDKVRLRVARINLENGLAGPPDSSEVTGKQRILCRGKPLPCLCRGAAAHP